MPAAHIVPAPEVQSCTVNKNGVIKEAFVLQKRPGELYVHFVGTDKRMDEWVPEDTCTMREFVPVAPETGSRKRKRGKPTSTGALDASSSSSMNGLFLQNSLADASTVDGDSRQNGPAPRSLTEEELDATQHKQLTAQRNFDTVIFDEYKIRPWYYSPYPLTEGEEELPASASVNQTFQRVPGVPRTSARAHGRTSDLLSGGLLRQYGSESTLWVCHFCFKYMVDGVPWELHKKDCKLKHPPGKKVYQRGAHIIWEVDGAKEKLYCQNLSLFGKLFIDVKTLFFDCDNFLFYVLTDAKSSEDHILGFFSKEKLSYDDYNLACIMTLPQYQRKGFGMLMIEFSYELSRRAGIVGTPERPLSDLGLRSYLTYWISTLIRFFRRVLSVLPPDVLSITKENSFPQLDEEDDILGEVERISLKKRKKSKGFDGEVDEVNVNAEASLCMMPLKDIPDPIFTTKRAFETTPTRDGGAETNVKVECTLAEIAAATNLRIDDAAFALNECGLLMRRLTFDSDGDAGEDRVGRGQVVVITRRMVEMVATEMDVKRMYMDLNCVIL